MSAAGCSPTRKEAIIVVSGLPRSGTSLMMQMLAAGGISVLADDQRTPDEDNPRGYLELDRIKRLKQDASWLPEARGRAIKVISQLLSSLPTSETYRVILLQRDLDEILASQSTMLARAGRPGGNLAMVRSAFSSHLAQLASWLPEQSYMSVLRIDYPTIIAEPSAAAKLVAEFIDQPLDIAAMAAAVDPSLYRNRAANPN